MNARLLRLLFCLALLPLLTAAAPLDRAVVLDFLAQWQAAASAPGLTAAVTRDGELIFSGGVGLADLEHDLPADGTTVHNIGSTSKAVAMIGLMQLVAQGKVSLDAEIQTYAPWFPKKEHPITVRHLLTHTSGLRHYLPTDLGPGGTRIFTQFAVFEESTRFWRDDALLFKPGTAYSYSSFATNLIHGIVEVASGLGFEDYLRRHVWAPAGLRATQFDVPSRVVKNRGRGYDRHATTGRFERALDENVSYKYAGGGMISTDEDLCRLGHALLADQLLPRTARDEMWKQQIGPEVHRRAADGKLFARPFSQALVWQVRTDASGRINVSHEGAVKGTRTILLIYPAESLVVAMHRNTEQNSDLLPAAVGLAHLTLAATAGK